MVEPAGTFTVLSADFVRAAPSLRVCDDGPEDRPEIAFVGRSNVGKSSLIGALIGRKKLVKTSRRPGHTKTINFFDVTVRGPGEANLDLRIVDLPGYGFARTSISERVQMGALMSGYLSTREPLVGVCQLLDFRHTPTKEDREMIEVISSAQRRYIPVATKCDKLPVSKHKPARVKLAKSIDRLAKDLVLFSTMSQLGREELWSRLWTSVM